MPRPCFGVAPDGMGSCCFMRGGDEVDGNGLLAWFWPWNSPVESQESRRLFPGRPNKVDTPPVAAMTPREQVDAFLWDLTDGVGRLQLSGGKHCIIY